MLNILLYQVFCCTKVLKFETTVCVTIEWWYVVLQSINEEKIYFCCWSVHNSLQIDLY